MTRDGRHNTVDDYGRNLFCDGEWSAIRVKHATEHRLDIPSVTIPSDRPGFTMILFKRSM